MQIPRGTETILLVDDEPLVLKVAKRILTGCGYHTVLAADGEEAVQMFQDYQQEIDLVVLDITLPKMDGYEVLAAIRNLDPNVKVILCSGQPASDTAPKTEKLAAGLPLLAKPMSTEALARTVRQVLDA